MGADGGFSYPRDRSAPILAAPVPPHPSTHTAMEGDVMGSRTRGMALVELAVVVAIIAILTAMAIPGFGALLERQRAGAAMGALSTQMQLARMAAITHRRPAVLCPSSD